MSRRVLFLPPFLPHHRTLSGLQRTSSTRHTMATSLPARAWRSLDPDEGEEEEEVWEAAAASSSYPSMKTRGTTVVTGGRGINSYFPKKHLESPISLQPLWDNRFGDSKSFVGLSGCIKAPARSGKKGVCCLRQVDPIGAPWRRRRRRRRTFHCETFSTSVWCNDLSPLSFLFQFQASLPFLAATP